MEKNGVRLGSTIGAVFGLVFVLVNAGPLPGSIAWRLVGVVAFVAVLVLAARSRVEADPPSPGALRVYLVCVAAEVVAIPVGARVLTALDQPDLVLPWVVLVVGVHFGPFARTFGAPVFLALSLALVLVALLGAVGVLAGHDDAPQLCGVVAGLVLIAGAAAGLRAPTAARRT